MTDKSTERLQFACDFDGDLHLFPKNLAEPDYEGRWHVSVLCSDGSRKEARLCRPVMCVDNGVVKNPLWPSGHQQVAGWDVDLIDASEIEIRIDSGPTIRIRHPNRQSNSD